MKTVADALARARALGLDRLDAQLLIAHLAGRDRSWVIAHAESAIDAAMHLELLFTRRAAGEPLAYLTGRREFHGLELHVTPAVLDPRPDTETLVDWAVELLAERKAQRFVDLGTGSGAVALAVKHAVRGAQVHALDADPMALAVACGNATRLGLNVVFHQGSWWEAVAGLQFDVAVSNPPYVATGDPHLAGLAHEPLQALVPVGDRGDGLADIERIVAGARTHLARGAWLLLEHGADQAPAVRRLFADHGFDRAQTRTDLAGRNRASGACWSA